MSGSPLHTARRSKRLPTGQFFAAWACLAAVVHLTACGGAPVQVASSAEAPDTGGTTRYATALRLAAVARIELRAAAYETAAEHFRAAYRSHPDVSFLVGYAQAAEQAKLYAEAHDAVRRALTHALPADQRQRLQAEVARLQPLVPPGLVRVAIQVSPEGARVELTRSTSGEAQRAPDRVVLGSGHVFLAPGTWNLYSVARAYQSDLRTFQVTPEGGELLAIALQPEETGPVLADRPRPRKAPKPQVQEPPKDQPPQDQAQAPQDQAPKDQARAQPPEPPEPPEEQGPVVEVDVPAPTGRSALHKWGPIGVSLLGVAALGAGGFFGWQVTQYAADANGLAASSKTYSADLQLYKDQAAQAADFANYAFVGGGVLLAAGTLWWVLAPTRPPAPARSSVTSPPAAAPSAASAWLPAAAAIGPSGLALSWDF